MAKTSYSLASSSEQQSKNAALLAEGSGQQRRLVDSAAGSIHHMATSSRTVAGNADNLANIVNENNAAMNLLTESIASVRNNAELMSAAVVGNSSAIEEFPVSIQNQA